ncbi:MAG: PQQ-like beta-propeller repeat protein [Fimbriimonas sp.]|nr:PQQ-like beta-propeller repeat protein [Fimbriimonas sp.]
MGTRLPVPVETGLPALIGVLGVAALCVWGRSYFSPVDVSPRDMGLNKSHLVRAASTNTSTSAVSIPLPGGLSASLAVPTMPGDWSGFRGPNRDNIGPTGSVVANSIDGVQPLWQVGVGEGYAAPCIKDGRVFLLDHDSSSEQDVLRCLALADGREVWRTGYSAVIKRNHGISRTIPATDGKSVVTLGPKCMVLCVDVATGKPKWQLDLVEKYGVTVPEWYAGQCPLIDGNRIIFATGGNCLFLALDLESGKELWTTPNPNGWLMTHSSIQPVTVDGEKTFVYCFNAGVAAVSAKDGKLLWDTDKWTVNTATVPTPLPVGGGRIFLSGGYNAGSMMLSVAKGSPTWSVKVEFRLGPEVFGSDQQTPIFYQGHIYGVRPGGELVCLDPQGKLCWSSGTAGRFGTASYLIADGKVVLLNDQGVMTLAEANEKAFKPLGSKPVLKGPEAWGPIAIAGDRVLVRDATSLACLKMVKS